MVDGAARAIGIGVAAVLDLLNVDRVVIGGGVANAGFFLLERIVGGDAAAHLPARFADVTSASPSSGPTPAWSARRGSA